jgi:hypothetical protein
MDFLAVRQFETSVRPVKRPDTPFSGGKAGEGKRPEVFNASDPQ